MMFLTVPRSELKLSNVVLILCRTTCVGFLFPKIKLLCLILLMSIDLSRNCRYWSGPNLCIYSTVLHLLDYNKVPQCSGSGIFLDRVGRLLSLLLTTGVTYEKK